jgi:hypothetical protein
MPAHDASTMMELYTNRVMTEHGATTMLDSVYALQEISRLHIANLGEARCAPCRFLARMRRW